MTQKKILATLIAAFALTAAGLAPRIAAQTPESKPQKPEPGQVQTFFLKNVNSTNELNDVQTALRNAVPRARFYASASSRSITVWANDEDLRTIEKVLKDLDRPKQSYRVTYTFADPEDGKRGNPQRYSLVVVGNDTTQFRQGNRVPIVTGKMGDEKGPEQQFQYVDVGINIKCTAESSALYSKVEVTSISDEKSTVGIQDPVIHQTVVEGLSPFTPGKSHVIGTIEVPGSNRRQSIEVLVEPVS